MHQRQDAVLGSQPLEHVRHRTQHGETRAEPLGPEPATEAATGVDDLRRSDALREQREHRLREHERVTPFEPLVEPLQHAVTVKRALIFDDDDSAICDLDLEGTGVIGEGIERRPRAQVEPGMVPMARDEPVLHGAAVQREAQLRAPVLDPVCPALVSEHADGLGPDLRRHVPRGLEVLDAAGVHAHDRLPSLSETFPLRDRFDPLSRAGANATTSSELHVKRRSAIADSGDCSSSTRPHATNHARGPSSLFGPGTVPYRPVVPRGRFRPLELDEVPPSPRGALLVEMPEPRPTADGP